MLDVSGVTVRYGERVAVNDLSLAVEAGNIVGLLGPNGAGKTTLIRAAMGLIPYTGGSIRLFDDDEPRSTQARARIGYMPQRLAIYPGLSIAENVAFFARAYGVPADRLEARVDEVLELVDLKARRDSVVHALSGGMARRTMLASALVHDPDLVILDEPTAGVDPMLRIAFWDWFGALAKRGTAILITTHHISEAVRCGDVVFLRQGAMIARGSPSELMGRYDSTNLEDAFVAATHHEGES